MLSFNLFNSSFSSYRDIGTRLETNKCLCSALEQHIASEKQYRNQCWKLVLISVTCIIQMYGGWWRWAPVSPDVVAPAGWSVCLPLLIFPCTIKSRSSLLALAHMGGPRKKAINGCGIESRIGRLIRFRIEFSNRIGRIYHASRNTV